MNPIKLEKCGTSGYKAYWENDVYLGHILCDVDGFYKFWPFGNEGYYDEWFLLSMYNQLKEMNKAWQEQIDNDPVFGLRNNDTQQGESV